MVFSSLSDNQLLACNTCIHSLYSSSAQVKKEIKEEEVLAETAEQVLKTDASTDEDAQTQIEQLTLQINNLEKEVQELRKLDDDIKTLRTEKEDLLVRIYDLFCFMVSNFFVSSHPRWRRNRSIKRMPI